MKALFDVIFNKCSKFVIKHSVEIAMGAAAVGVGLTVFTTSKATLKVNDICKDETLTKSQKIKKSVKPVAPAAASVLLAYAGITAMYITGRKKQAALLGLLVSSQQVFQQYRNVERGKIGTKAEAELYSEAVERTGVGKSIPDMPKKEDEITFCDSVTGQCFTSTLSDIYKAMYLANREFILHGELEFNTWLEYIGCDDDDILYGFGWEQCKGLEFYGYQFIDFVLVPKTDKEGKQYRLITYPFLPHALYPDEMGCGEDDLLMLNPSIDTDLWKKMSAEEKEEILQQQMAEVAVT